jgi:hypothetical protein
MWKTSVATCIFLHYGVVASCVVSSPRTNLQPCFGSLFATFKARCFVSCCKFSSSESCTGSAVNLLTISIGYLIAEVACASPPPQLVAAYTGSSTTNPGFCSPHPHIRKHVDPAAYHVQGWQVRYHRKLRMLPAHCTLVTEAVQRR